VLTVEGVTKRYRRGPQANDGITFTARAGEVLGLLGHNGAGKTTLVNQVLGLLRPDAGTITVDGATRWRSPTAPARCARCRRRRTCRCPG
jgi:ABC-2 type transport system ATP-binding protein